MLKKFSTFALIAVAGFASVAPAFAQSSVSRIDAEHSTARLYLASSTNPDANLNVGVARTAGVVKLNPADSAIPDYHFQIYPAYKHLSLAASRREAKPDYTIIAFKSRRVVPLAANSYRVSGDLTLTFVQRTVSYDPSEGYSGPTYGPSITLSQSQPASFEFHRATASDNTAAHEWIPSSNISVQHFPELMTAVSSTVWPVFVADEKCSAPSNLGTEDYSGPACTGERIDATARKDLSCDTPLPFGEDFSAEVCTQVAPSIVTPDQCQTFSARHQHNKTNANHIVANEIQIRLDLFTTGPGSAISVASRQ